MQCDELCNVGFVWEIKKISFVLHGVKIFSLNWFNGNKKWCRNLTYKIKIIKTLRHLPSRSELTEGCATTAEMKIKFPREPTESTGTYGFIAIARIYNQVALLQCYNTIFVLIRALEKFSYLFRYSCTSSVTWSWPLNWKEVQWNFEHRTQSVPGDGSTFELNFPIWNNANWINPFQTPKIYQI
jgi:hypothetical protein